ncbi:hypothetical protein F5Y19DRAFT_256637 [Xylariaceae sp. FL1651]|nr:hypothetical protein F5Y19DRAFT_256637 [Xylariaceae sp. FL1651]
MSYQQSPPMLPEGLLEAPEHGTGLEQTSFEFSLDQLGDEGSGYHTRNDPHPLKQYQRNTITERRGAIEVRCKAREVVHGLLGPEEDVNATLLVYDFSFNASKLGRRITSANISFKFHGMQPGASAPTIHGLAPYGHFILLPTSQEESSTVGAKVDAGGSFFGVGLNGAVKWEKTTSSTTNDATSLNGATECDEFGKEIGVNWIIHENKTTKTGIPSFLRAVILLSREDDAKFQGTFEMRVEADWKTELSRFFGAKTKDDPILFDPRQKPTSNLRKAGYDLENLSAVNLKELSDVSFHTLIEGAVKHS